MARGYKRLTRKARHVIRHLRRTKHASVQDQMIHELRHEVSRTHGFKGPGKAPDRSKAGHWRPLTRKAKQMLTRLRKAKVWSVQKQIVNELAREIERGRRVADRARQAAVRARNRAQAAAKRVSVRAGRFRETASRGQERLLARAERKQAGREKRHPAPRGTLRQRFGPGRVRAIWKQRRWERTTPRDRGWERSRYNAQSPRYRPLPERPRNAGRGPRPVPARRRTPRPAPPARTR